MKNRKRIWMASAIICGAALAAGVSAQGVKVNGKEIPATRIDAVVKSQIAQGQPDSPELRNRVRDELINREILAQEAQKKGLDKQPEVAAQIEFTRQEVLFNAYLREYLRANPVTEDAMKKEFERVKTQLPAKEYKAHHILVEKEDEAKGLIAQIKKGAKFEKLASENSKDQGSKGKGGELDWSPAERYVKPFGDALSKLKKGQMTDAPVQSQFGWHIIRLDEERATKVPGYDEVKPQLQQMMQSQAIQKLVADLRTKAKVE
ncbi:MAG TPA: peptidylprolyl isomerase [Burkholderiales bacterium]|nr:peptidylprolyl isomerase [Burkholderiales bacterium]